MNKNITIIDSKIKDLATRLSELKENIILIFAFNGTGKTRLSVEYKNITKSSNKDKHAGVYYNAYSEDLFVWYNDPENLGLPIKLNILPSSLNQFHSSLNENKLREKLVPYNPKFDFTFSTYEDNPEKGIESITFFQKTEIPDGDLPPIKISRGEERIFIWCFFLTLFDVEGINDNQNKHFFIDDPVSSLDDHNIFVTASTMMDLINEHFKTKKIIITTHHVGFFSILCDWLKTCSKNLKKHEKNKIISKILILKNVNSDIKLLNNNEDVFLYHLELLQIFQNAITKNELRLYHFALLRQVLENIASFLGVSNFSYTLKQIGVDNFDEIADIINRLTHKKPFIYESVYISEYDEALFLDIFKKLQAKYNFVIHAGGK